MFVKVNARQMMRIIHLALVSGELKHLHSSMTTYFGIKTRTILTIERGFYIIIIKSVLCMFSGKYYRVMKWSFENDL